MKLWQITGIRAEQQWPTGRTARCAQGWAAGGLPHQALECTADLPLPLAALQGRLGTVVGELKRLAHAAERPERRVEHWPDRAERRFRRHGATLVHVLTHGAHHRSRVIHKLGRWEVQDGSWGNGFRY